jgi:hypothetical protein
MDLIRKRGWLLVTAVITSIPSVTRAQAWVGAERSLTVSLGYEYSFHDLVYEGDYQAVNVPGNEQSIRLGADFVPIEHLSLRAAVPLYLTQYNGPQVGSTPNIIVAHGPYDDGKWHAKFQDFTAAVGYQLLGEDGLVDFPLALTPYVRLAIPLGHYATSGYAAPGMGLKRLSFGFDAGLRDLILNGTYIQAGYAYTIVEKDTDGGEITSQFNLNRSEASAAIGYFILRDLRATLFAALLYTHGGLQLIDLRIGTIPNVDVLKRYHDPILQVKALLPGLEVAYGLTDSIEVRAAFELLVWGDNIVNTKILHVGVAWSPLGE